MTKDGDGGGPVGSSVLSHGRRGIVDRHDFPMAVKTSGLPRFSKVLTLATVVLLVAEIVGFH